MKRKTLLRILSGLLLIIGAGIVFFSVYPIITYEWEAAVKYPVLISPLVDEEKASFKLSGKDYTKASTWFPEAQKETLNVQNIKYFTISIPKLEIEGASVSVGGDDLSQSLIQFPGTSLPGEIGNTVIFGHSVLPRYFDPDNYLTIFSTLPKIEENDDIYVDFDGIRYRYQVESMFEVTPNDIQILEQSGHSPYLSLVTCTPPGHPLKPKRLIVRAKLVPFNET